MSQKIANALMRRNTFSSAINILPTELSQAEQKLVCEKGNNTR